MNLTRTIEVFNPNTLTVDSKVKLNGNAVSGSFGDEIVTIVSCTYEELIVRRKRRKCTIYFWEYQCDVIEIEMVDWAEPEVEPLPF